MDDLLKSVPDDPTAVKLQHELTTLLARGGFRLTKWSSSRRGFKVRQTSRATK